VYVDGLSPFQFVPSELYSKTHLDFCDSISKLKFREAGQQKKLYKKLAFLHEAVSIYIREFLAILNVKSVSFISESETEVYPFVFSKNNFATKLLILNQGLDNDLFKYTEPKTDSKQILFFGALDYFPNDDAAMWFGTEIFSTLKKHFPSLEFHIVGKSPSKDITQLGSRDGIFVHANVPEMQPYLENAKIIVVPLRVGAGVKNKILIAALSGRPIVSTSVGLEGLDDSLIRGIYKADNVEEFVAQIRLILSEDNQSLKIKLETLSKTVLEVYSWENSAEQIYNSVR